MAPDQFKHAKAVFIANDRLTIDQAGTWPRLLARLFQVGVTAGRDFLEALESHQITDDDVRKEVPVVMLLVLQGPTTDFIVGRVFESASNLAFDDIVKTNDAGLTLEKMSDWVMDKEAQKIKAHSKFVGTNCALIK